MIEEAWETWAILQFAAQVAATGLNTAAADDI